MTDVFISYSRKDKAFVQVLNQALADSKYDAWVDWENIPLTADWWEEIKAGIEGADTFIFVISPDSIASKVCGQEIDHAVENNKRLLPIVYREGFDMPQVRPALGKHNWLFFKEDNDFDQAFASLVETLNTDLSHVKTHTRLLVRALEWEKKQRSDDFLLRGSDLQEAEGWLAGAEHYEPLPTEQHKNYVTKSREVEDARQRLTAAGEKAKRLVRIGAGVLAGTIAIATVVGIFTQRNVLRTRKLAEIEQNSINALQQFEYQQLEGLVQAMKAAEDLRDIRGGGDQPLRTYVPQSAPRVLQQILDQISLKNTFSNNPEAFLDEATSVNFSPDGKALVITGGDGTVTLKTPKGIDIRSLNGHSQKVYQANFSPDGQLIGTTSDVFRLFDRDGTLLKTLEHPSGNAGRIRFSPDGKYIAISGWGKDSISLLDLAGNLVTTIDAQAVSNFDFHPNKPLLASASRNNTVEIWDFQGNKISTLEGHESYVRSVRFGPTGDYLVSGSADYSVRLWNLKDQTSKTMKGLDGWINTVDFHPDGEKFAAGSSGGIAKIWDLEGNVVQTFPGHVGNVSRVRFSPDGRTLATTADDGQVRVWSLKGKAAADLDGHTNALWHAALSPDGTHIATASLDGTTRIWDISGVEISRLDHPTGQTFNNVVYSPDGNTIVTSTALGDIQLWDAKGNFAKSLVVHGQRILGLDLSPDGQYGLSGSDDNTAKLWDLDGNVRTVVTHDTWIRDVAFSPDGQTFATASEDDFMRLWDLDGNLLAEFAGHADGVNGISFSPDGTKLVTASDDSTVKLWDLQGNLTHSFQKHHGRVWAVAFSPNGDSIATGTSDGYARLWDLDGNLISEFKGHEASVTSVNFTPDGQHLVTTSGDGTAKVWRIARTLDDLLTQGCEWLADYLTIHPNTLMELESCQRPELLPQAAPYLVQKAMQAARTDKTPIARQKLATALTWNPDVDLDPETPEAEENATQVVRKFSAAYNLREGQQLANQLKLEAAIQAYEKALELDTEIDLDPDTEVIEQDVVLVARRYAALGLRKRGQLQAQQLNIDAAIQTLKESLELDPNIDLNPDTEEVEQDAKAMANRFSAPGHLAAGQQQVRNGEVEAAVQAYKTAQELDPEIEIDRRNWDTLCWFGSVHGKATAVRFACENEVAFGGVSTADSRGIVLAMDGDIEGAISNFQGYIEYTNDKERETQAQNWIDVLKARKNPFKP